jgi:hypothetical protein
MSARRRARASRVDDVAGPGSARAGNFRSHVRPRRSPLLQVRPRRALDPRRVRRQRSGLQLRDLQLRFAPPDPGFFARADDVLAVSLGARGHFGLVPARKPIHPGSAAAAGRRRQAPAERASGRQRATAEPRVQVRLLPRQLRHPRARHDRLGDRRPAARGRPAPGAVVVARPGPPHDRQLPAALRGDRPGAGTGGGSSDRPKSWPTGWPR